MTPFVTEYTVTLLYCIFVHSTIYNTAQLSSVGFVNKNIHSCLSKLRGKFRETERSSIRSSNEHIYRIFDKTFVWFKLLCSSERCVSSKKGRWTSNIIIDAEIFLLTFFAKYLSDDNVIYLGLNRFKYLQLTRSPDYFAFINQLQLLAIDLYSPWLRTAKFCRILCYVTKASIGTPMIITAWGLHYQVLLARKEEQVVTGSVPSGWKQNWAELFVDL